MSRILRDALGRALSCLVLVASPSCTFPPKSSRPPMPQTLVIFGDSTSAARPNVRVFAAILQDNLPGAVVINAGVPGNNTSEALARLDRDVISRHPDVVTIFFGINDSAVDVWKGATEPRVPLVEYQNNLRKIVRAIRNSAALPILMTPNPVAWTPELLKLYDKPPYQ